ncbi:HI0074 family nucleotidyltransferase substrate-binding subunit [bacterium]
MKLDLTSFKKAIESFENSINVACNDKKMESFDISTQETIKAGVIQNFEFTYELCWKFIQRWLKENYIKEEAEFPRTRKELFRLAARASLLEDASVWFKYTEARNMTSHIYAKEVSETVFNEAVKFIIDAKILLNNLEQKND